MTVSRDPESLARAVAAAVVSEARRSVERGGRFTIALSGGSTPRRTYELLGRTPFSEEMPWGSTHVFWSDERCVGSDDPRSNERMAREALLDHVPLSAGQIHPICCVPRDAAGTENQSAAVAEAAATEYEAVLRVHAPTLDLVLLGLGTDGHTASLFPGSDALYERERWVAAVPHDPLWRVTLTAPFVNKAAAVFFVVGGAEKASVLRQVIEGGSAERGAGGTGLPAQLIAPFGGRLVWFVDEEAAVQIDRGKLPG